MVRCNLKLLIAKKEIEEGHRVSYRDIQEMTGIAPSTLVSLANSDFKAIYTDTIEKLCEFFDCDVCDLLVYVPDSAIPGDGHGESETEAVPA